MESQSLHDELRLQLLFHWQPQADKPDESPEQTLRTLWLFVSSRSEQDGRLPELDDAATAQLKGLVARRQAGEPLSYLIGRQCFMGTELLASPEAMIPRKETELLGHSALEALGKLVKHPQPTTVIDLCTGSGNIALILAQHESICRVFGSDISEDAVRLAKRNALHLGLADRVEFRVGDFLTPFESREFLGSVDLITCNPPYISTARAEKMVHEIAGFEPRLAFDGGPYGVKLLTRLVKEAIRFVRSEGWVVCETGLGQGESMARMFEKNLAYSDVKTYCDEQNHVRAIAAQVRRNDDCPKIMSSVRIGET